MRALLAIALVGCNFNPPPGNGPDAPVTDARPDGTPDVPPVDGLPDTPPVLDGDGDGIPDADDNCPALPNADQRNFDADPRGDSCDACPHLASDTDPDGDSDGVGDACDPRPETTGDTRLLWTAFQDANSIAGWTLSGGTWELANGRLRQTDTAPVIAYASPPLTVPRAYVATRFRVGTLGTPSEGKDPGYGVSGGYGSGGAQYYACIVTDTGLANYLVAVSAWAGHPQTFGASLWFGAFGAGAAIELTHSSASGNRCNARTATTSATAMDQRGPTAGAAILYTQRAAGEFDYMFVVSIP
ncbi:MAG: thrombospondin type 3 repeat-containing protein [Kofleriaceae bacterium]